MNWVIPQSLKTEFISGLTFYKISKYNLCPRYDQLFDINLLNEDDLLFLNLDYYEQFTNFVISNRINKKFTLITHNSDRDFTKDMFTIFENHIKHIFAINCTYQHNKITKIPLGFNDQSTEILDKKDFSFKEKQNLIYMNFKIHHHIDRKKCFDYFNQFNWVDKDQAILSYSDFYDKLNTYKYCISPRGTGIDTHRLYESLLFGVLPIVKKSELDDLYKSFPVILVNDWNEITYEFLNENYETFLKNLIKWKEENKNWFLPKFWIK